MRKRLIRGWISLIPLALVTYVVLHVYQETQGAWPSVVSESQIFKSQLRVDTEVTFLNDGPFSNSEGLKDTIPLNPSVILEERSVASKISDLKSSSLTHAENEPVGLPLSSKEEESKFGPEEAFPKPQGENYLSDHKAVVDAGLEGFEEVKHVDTHLNNDSHEAASSVIEKVNSTQETALEEPLKNTLSFSPQLKAPVNQNSKLDDPSNLHGETNILSPSGMPNKTTKFEPEDEHPDRETDDSLLHLRSGKKLLVATNLNGIDDDDNVKISNKYPTENNNEVFAAQNLPEVKETAQNSIQNEIIVPSRLLTKKGNGNLSRNNLSFANHSSAVTPTRASLSSQSSSLPLPPADSTSQNVSKTTPVTKHTLPIDYLKGKVLVRDRYEAGFSTPHEDLCPSNGSGLKLFVFVTSAPDHERQRRAIRLTWGSFVLRKDLSLAFVIGRTSNSEIQSNIDKENELYGDVIEANFIDHYSNLTLKTMSIFEWLHLHCTDVKFVLKTDDDMFINIPLLLALVDTRKSDKKTIYGRYARNWGPVRNKKSKYYIDHKTYSRTKYPNFLTGPAYLFTSDVADLLFQRTMAAPFFTLEDVLVTGFVAESLGLRRIGVSHFKNDRIKLTDVCKLKRAISIHMVKYDEQFDIHKKILDGKTKCKTR